MLPLLYEIAQKTAPFHAIASQLWDDIVRAVHVIPSGDVATTEPGATAANKLPFQAISFHDADEGSVRDVQVIPSGDVAAVVPAPGMLQNTTPFHAIAYAGMGIECDVHVIPSGDVAQM
jgi:hypothetical protein